MGFSQIESTDSGQMVAANSDRAHAASVRMFDEVSNYQVDGRATMKAGQAGQSSDSFHGGCDSAKDYAKILDNFGISDLSERPKPSIHEPRPNAHEPKPKPHEPQSKPPFHDHKPDSQPSKPWRPENGVCAPGSPIKINCFDEKDGKGDIEQKLQKLQK